MALEMKRRWQKLVLAGVFGLAACDWRHVVQLHVSPVAAEATFSAAVAAAARKASFVEDDRWAKSCPWGSFVEPGGFNTSQVIRICAGRNRDTAVVDLSEFNKGTPWCPDARFVQVRDALDAELRGEFGSNVKVIKGAWGRLTIEPAAKP